VQTYEPLKLLVFQSAIGSACFLVASVLLESGAPTRYTPALAATLFYQGAVVAGFNFIVNSYLFKVYLASRKQALPMADWKTSSLSGS
jgi:hypothetical protein